MVAPVTQGTINRLKGSVVFATLPSLGVTSPFLAKEAISLSFDGNVATKIPTLTGAVDSPEPYVMATAEIHLLRTQAIAQAYKAQVEDTSQVGSVNIIGDSDAMEAWQLEECVILSAQPGAFDGNNPTYVIRIQGIYYVNRALWVAS